MEASAPEQPDEGGRRIHSTAIVDEQAEIDSDVTVGPYSVIGPNVVIGSGCVIGAHVVIEGNTIVGRNNRIFSGAVIGSQTQDLKYSGGTSQVVIGDNNTIREYATVNTSTSEGNATRIGNDNLIMAYAHIAHECAICNNVIMANSATLGGHVLIEDRAIVGGLAGVHQFVRIGTMAIVGGCSKATKDVLPYSMVDGHPARWQGINTVGMRRGGLSEEVRARIKKCMKILCRSNLNTTQALDRLRAEVDSCVELDHIIEFVESSNRGVCK